jgi:hypothetical protein
MRVQFTATFDELVDVTVRAIKRVRGEKQASRWIGPAVCSLATAALIALVANPEGRWIGAAVGGVVGGLVFALVAVRPIDGPVRAWVKRSVGTDAPFEVVVELTPDGLSFHQMNTHTVHAWALVEEIEEDNGDVVFHVKHGNILVVRARAFDTADARQRFVELAKQLRSVGGGELLRAHQPGHKPDPTID